MERTIEGGMAGVGWREKSRPAAPQESGQQRNVTAFVNVLMYVVTFALGDHTDVVE